MNEIMRLLLLNLPCAFEKVLRGLYTFVVEGVRQARTGIVVSDVE